MAVPLLAAMVAPFGEKLINQKGELTSGRGTITGFISGGGSPAMTQSSSLISLPVEDSHNATASRRFWTSSPGRAAAIPNAPAVAITFPSRE